MAAVPESYTGAVAQAAADKECQAAAGGGGVKSQSLERTANQPVKDARSD